MTSVGKEFAALFRGNEICDDSKSPMRGARASRNVEPSMGTKKFSSYSCCVCFVFLYAAEYLRAVSAVEGTLISLNVSSLSCSSNLICLGGAHVYQESQSNGATGYIQVPENLNGRLSLLPEEKELSSSSVGIAYYKDPVRLLDPSSRASASFNTSFTIDTVLEWYESAFDRFTGDGLVFVISADSSHLGAAAECFGFFNASGFTNFKSIVVEYDEFQNAEAPEYDISGNHVSFDFSNITWVAAANASDVGVLLWWNLTIYAWVEYSNDTQQLEARISNNNSRPIEPLLSYTVDLFDVAEEYMWVGFASGTGFNYSHYYIGNWVFESYGIPGSGTASKSGRSEKRLIVGICLGVFGLFLLVFMVIFVRRWSRERGWRQMIEEDPVIQLEGMPERFSFKQLSVATDSFSSKKILGQGGFGSVHRGVLPTSGIAVAVKKISSESNQGEKEFMAEMSIISRLRHRNLIQLLGWCKDVAREKYLLVYELMPNGSLDKLLFRPPGNGDSGKGRPHLSWKQRFNIVTGTAAAVNYLHQGWKQQVIHRDIKSSNIMLDGEWNAKLGDFGLARLVDHKRAANTTVVAGTYGYIAPEAAASGRFTDKTDVFAFGAVVLEIACGRKAFSLDASPEETVLVDWVWRSLSEGKLLNTVDKEMEEYDPYWMEVVLIIGLLCSHPNPSARPCMRHVVQVLAGEAPVPSIPASKPEAFCSELPQSLWINDPHGRRKAMSTSTSGSTSFLSPNVLDSPTASFKPGPFGIEPRSIWIDDLESPKCERISRARSQSLSLIPTSFSDSAQGDSTVDKSSKSLSSNSSSSISRARSFNI